MGKYIVELKKNETLYKATTRESDGTAYVCSAIGTPYTAPDLEQIRKEAYKDGYDAGFGRKIDASYQEGLADAWEAARTLWNTPNRKEVFGHIAFNTTLTTLTAQEAIEKIRQYEQEKEEQDGLRQNIQTIVDQCGYSLDEIAEVLQKMKETDNG